MRITSLVLLVASGCVPSHSAVFGPVARESRQRVGVEVAWGDNSAPARAAVAALIDKPLDLDAAVRVALSRNQRLQAQFEELGIAASRVADATVLPPMTVDVDHKWAIHGSDTETELTVVQDVLDLLQIGQRRSSANAELDATRARAVAATVDLAARVEIAFNDHTAAKQELELVQTASAAAAASAEIAARQHAAGNVNDLTLAREREQSERLRVDVSRAEQNVADTRARLGALLGLSADQGSWQTVGKLADVPVAVPVLDDLDRQAAAANLDAAAFRADADAAGSRHRYAMVRAWLPTLGAGLAVANRHGEWEAGPALRIGIPLFDQQQGPRARALAEQARANRERAATQVELDAVVQAARTRVQRAFSDVHQIADVVMPLRQQILDQTVLHYNAMDATPFELVVAKRDMVDAGRQYVDALRRYWNALAQVKALRRGGHVQLGDSAP